MNMTSKYLEWFIHSERAEENLVQICSDVYERMSTYN